MRPRQKHEGGRLAEAVVGPLGVVGREPGVGDLLHLVEGVEEVGVEDLLTKRAIQSLDEGILIRLPGLDVADADTLRPTPVPAGLGGELGPVVHAYPGGAAVQLDEIIQDPDHAGARNGRPDLDRESLPIAFVEDVEGPKPAAVVERVGHEIEGPGRVQARWREQGLAEARREAPFRPPRQIEPERAVHSMHPLVIPPMPGAAQAIEALPKAPARMPGDHLIQRADDVEIPPQAGARRSVVRRPREPHRLAGAPHRHAVLVDEHAQDLAFRGRRHRFRLRTSLIAAFSRASSAYIRFSFVFSASSSFSRFNSSIDAPAYFDRQWKYVALLMLCSAG